MSTNENFPVVPIRTESATGRTPIIKIVFVVIVLVLAYLLAAHRSGPEAGIGSAVMVAGIMAALACKPLRKTMGLLLVIVGFIACLSVIGMLVGIPMIVVGGIFMFS